MSITWVWVLVTNYQRYMAFCPSYILPKIKKTKIKLRSNYPKTLNFKTKLWNEKVLSTHFAQTESGLLDFHYQCTPLCMIWMICCIHETYLTKLNHINLFMNVSSSLLKKKKDLFLVREKKNDLIHKKIWNPFWYK